MNKTTKRVLALMLAVMMLVSALAACGDNAGTSSDANTSSSSESTPSSEVSSEPGESSEGEDEPAGTGAWTAPEVFDMNAEDYNHDDASSYYYDYTLGDFYKEYEVAKAEKLDVNKRYVLEALAEAKLLAAAVMLPTTANGGNYAIGRTAPGSVTTNSWGNDSERHHNMIVTTEPIKTADRDHLKEMLLELRGTHTYEAEARKWLTENGYTLKDSYTQTFTSFPVSWDLLSSSRTTESYPVVPTFDGLVEYDGENNENPALAESWDVSEDGLTYTFHIRKGVKWVDSQGREVADVKADDWVAGLQHAVDCGAGLGDLMDGVIMGLHDYISGETNDFTTVGITASDDNTLVYTLEEPCTYFLSMLHYSCAVPMSRDYYTSQGGKFGADFDPEDPAYVYGSDPDHIAYNGPYLITNATEQNSINYEANPTYWNADNITIKKINWLYNDNTDPTKAYNDMKAGTIDATGLNTSAVEAAKTDKVEGTDATWFDTYQYVTSTGMTSYQAFLNVMRSTWHNDRDENEAVSPQTPEDAARTHIAMNNVHFRRALVTSVDRVSWNAQTVGDTLAPLSLRNSYTPGTFCQLTEDVTIDVNGESMTFPAGTDYGKILQAGLDAEGFKITVYKEDPSAENGVGTSDGFDGWYDPAYALSELNIAIEELATAGVTVDESNPIQVDLPCPTYDTNRNNQKNSMKQSIEKALEGKVIVNLVSCDNSDAWMYSGYWTDYGYQANYELFDLSGWGPDYQDPCSYLDTMLPDYSGYMAKSIGLF